MDLLKRELAPILPEAWAAIDEEARRVFHLRLGARRLVDVDGPHGWKLAAVNTGRLELFREEPVPEVHVGRRLVLPLMELRIPVEIAIMELDYVTRGSRDPDLDNLRRAAEKVAQFEDRVVFLGWKEAGIGGIVEAGTPSKLPLPQDPGHVLEAVLQSKEALRAAGIGGAYAIAAGPAFLRLVALGSHGGVPLETHLKAILGGPIVPVPALDGAVVLSTRGGDFVLTVGQDLSVGYADKSKHTIELYITESFTFQVVEPRAAVVLRASK